jgi:hypothetical protein
MDALIKKAMEKHFETQMAHPGLAKAYESHIIRQNEIYDAICQGVEKMESAPLEKHSDIVIQSQVFLANIQAAFGVMKAQSTEHYRELRSALGDQIQHSGKSWGTLSTLFDNRERTQEPISLQLYSQSQELADVRIKAQEDGEQMSAPYAKSHQEAQKIKEKVQKKADHTEVERKAAERKMKKDFERKFKEFTRVLQTKFSDERMKRSVHSLAR